MRLNRILTFCILMCCFSVVFAAQKHKFTLVIDAGHGGKDAGACANGAKEKNINLNVALAFGRYVEQNCSDVRVIYTRKTDVFIPLHERAAIANRNKADVFISIHTNALPGKRPKPVTGMETYTMGMRRSNEKLSAAMRENEVVLIEDNYRQHYAGYDPRSPESILLFQLMNEQNMLASVEMASLIQQYTCRTANRPNKGVRQDAFLVLRETSMPACLVELGYITTPSDAASLTNKKNVDLMGRGLYQAFVAFKKSRTGKGSATVVEPEQPKVETPQPVQPKAEVAPVEQPVQQEAQTVPAEQPQQQEPEPKAAPVEKKAKAADANEPVFKIQFLTSSTKLKNGDARLKGLTDVDCYKEGGVWKYTIGSSTNYNEIYRLRKQVMEKFPQAFIIAFKNGEKVDAAKAYQEYKQRKNIK